MSTTHQEGSNDIRLPAALASAARHSTAQPSMLLAALVRNWTSHELFHFTVVLKPVSAAQPSSMSPLAAGWTKHHMLLHYRAASCPFYTMQPQHYLFWPYPAWSRNLPPISSASKRTSAKLLHHTDTLVITAFRCNH